MNGKTKGREMKGLRAATWLCAGILAWAPIAALAGDTQDGDELATAATLASEELDELRAGNFDTNTNTQSSQNFKAITSSGPITVTGGDGGNGGDGGFGDASGGSGGSGGNAGNAILNNGAISIDARNFGGVGNFVSNTGNSTTISAGVSVAIHLE